MQTNQHLKEILLRYIKGTISETDREILFSSLADDHLAEEWKVLIKEVSSEVNINEPYNESEWEPMIQDILKHQDKAVTPVRHPSTLLRMTSRRTVWTRVAAAAVIILLLSVGGYFYFTKNDEQQVAKTETRQQRLKNDVTAPTGTKAMITLANGQTIALESLTSGTLAKQGNVSVIKTADGKIVYSGTANEMVFNTLSNPRGSSVVDMTLSDGSRVWLNAGSSVTYPVAFIGSDRKVEMKGEAYFEVAHDASKPFNVSVNGMQVQVLGTHFNINAYDDENVIRTTLLEGSVKILRTTENDKGVIIKPGQQSQLANNNIKIENADVDEVMAWKNGKFKFSDGAEITAVMRQIARWYDVDIEYKGKITGRLGGTISRNVNASQVFKMLEMTGTVKFEIDGRKVIVMQ